MILRNDLLDIVQQKFATYGAENEPVKIIHIRNESDQLKDIWNDYLCFIDRDGNLWVSQGTTDPGVHAYVKHPRGAAHICIGFHVECWIIDIHAADNPRFAHEALCSRFTHGCKPIRYFRDNNRNRILDKEDTIFEDYVGLNCHRASSRQNVATIGLYGEGCQVRRNIDDHLHMMSQIKMFDCVSRVKDYRFSWILSPINEWNNLL